MSESRKESMVGCALVGGLILAGLGMALTIMLYMGGATALMKRQDPGVWAIRGLGPGLVLLGLLTSAGALVYGIREGRRVTGKGAMVDPGARVLARYAVARNGEMVVDEWLFDETDGLKFYVKLELTGGAIREFQCLRPVLAQCGEGMVGAATFDGKWLGSFVPTLGKP